MICSYDCSVPSTPYSVFDDGVSTGPDDPDDLVALTHELHDRQWSIESTYTSNTFYPAFLEERGHNDEGLYMTVPSTFEGRTVAAGLDLHGSLSEWYTIIQYARWFAADIVRRNLAPRYDSDSERSRYESTETNDDFSEWSSESGGECEAYVAKHQRYVSPVACFHPLTICQPHHFNWEARSGSSLQHQRHWPRPEGKARSGTKIQSNRSKKSGKKETQQQDRIRR